MNPNNSPSDHYSYNARTPDGTPRVVVPPVPQQWSYQYPQPMYNYQSSPQSIPPNSLHEWQFHNQIQNSNANAHAHNAQVHAQSLPSRPPSKPVQPKQHSQPPSAVAHRDQPSLPANVSYDNSSDRLLLLYLSDEFLAAARRLAVSIARRDRHADRSQYNKLMSTALACLEAAYRLPVDQSSPRQLALVRMRFAALSYQETADFDRLEEVLASTSTLCETNRLISLRLSAQHYLVRTVLRRNRKTAMVSLDRLIHECTTCQYTPWIYAFRFLKVSIAIKDGDTNAALQNLKALSELGKQRADAAISYAAAIFEALLWLRTPRLESHNNAQRCLATARGLQTTFGPQEMPQLQSLLHMTDAATGLDPFDPKAAQERVAPLQQLLEGTLRDCPWPTDGTLSIPFRVSQDDKLLADTCGIFGETRNGFSSISLAWLNRHAVTVICYLLSGACVFNKSTHAGNQTERYLAESLRLTSDEAMARESSTDASLGVQIESVSVMRELRAYALLHSVHASCNRSQWDSAATHLKALTSLLSQLSSPPGILQSASTYLHGVIAQGSGDLDAALGAYQSPELVLDPPKFQQSSCRSMYAMLAIFNTLFIVRSPQHPRHNQIPAYIDQLRPLFPRPSTAATPQNHPTLPSVNAHLYSAYAFLLAALPQQMTGAAPTTGALTSSPSPSTAQPSILTTKAYLQASMSAAKPVLNSLLVTLCLNFMNHSFYRSIVGAQARQAADVARATAGQAGLTLWKDFSESVRLETLAREQGIGAEGFGVGVDMSAVGDSGGGGAGRMDWM